MMTWITFSTDNVMVGRNNSEPRTYHPSPTRGNRLLRAVLASNRFRWYVQQTRRGKVVTFYERKP